jgi:hydroxyethylthiazole kinase-like uncharacterized protein yjeF
MSRQETALFTIDLIRDAEQQAMSFYGIDEDNLMSKAATEAFFFLLKHYPLARKLDVFCGCGNNAGDGYLLAQLAHQHGLMVTVYCAKAIEELQGAAKKAAHLALSAGIPCQMVEEGLLFNETDLIIDALLGTGLQGVVRGSIALAIQQINASGLPVLSLDLPSGLNADTGEVKNLCIQAHKTISFIALKQGMYTLDGPDYCGEIHCRSLGLDSYLSTVAPSANVLNSRDFLPLPRRKKNSHKGDYGHVLVIGGGPGMPGAVGLAAKAALKTGAGVVSIATFPTHASAMISLIPEAMVFEVDSVSDLEPLLLRASICIIGPGLGQTDWAKSLFECTLSSQLPMIIDASALRLLAQTKQADPNWVLTPHPGEAAALLHCATEVIQANRYHAVEKLQQRYDGVVVLKGCGSVIQTVDAKQWVCPKGSPAMASAGMGDVLSGVIAGLAAQGLSLSDAAKLGVLLHAAAGDRLAKTIGERGILASELCNLLPLMLEEFSC